LSHSTAAGGAELVCSLVLVTLLGALLVFVLDPDVPEVLVAAAEDEAPLAPIVVDGVLELVPVAPPVALVVDGCAVLLVSGDVVVLLGATALVEPVLEGATCAGSGVPLSPHDVAHRLAVTAAIKLEPLTTKGKARKRMSVT
jgi:hypothetical protein